MLQGASQAPIMLYCKQVNGIPPMFNRTARQQIEAAILRHLAKSPARSRRLIDLHADLGFDDTIPRTSFHGVLKAMERQGKVSRLRIGRNVFWVLMPSGVRKRDKIRKMIADLI